MTVQVKQLFGEESLGIIPGDWNDPVIDCHEACSSDFDRCWDGCDSDDEDCHEGCAAESDLCDALCDDFNSWDEEGDHLESWEDRNGQHDFEACEGRCDDEFDTCIEACDGDEECEQECEAAGILCDDACLEAEDDWTPEEWQELEDELRNK